MDLFAIKSTKSPLDEGASTERGISFGRIRYI